MEQIRFDGAIQDDAFAAVYRKYSKAVTRYLARVLCDRDLAEDISQDVFLRLFEKNVRLDPGSPRTLSYLFSAAKHAAIDFMRRKRVEREKIGSLRLEEAEMDRRFYEDIGNAQIRGEILSTLSDVLHSFPEKHRELLVRRNLENRDAASVARDSGTTLYRFRKIEQEFNRRIRESLGSYFSGSD